MTGCEIKEKYTAALCALRSYKSIGFFSREYAILRSRETLEKVEKEFQEANGENRKLMESKLKVSQLLTYRELFEKMFLSIEDFAAIVSALMHPLEEFHMWVAKTPNIKKVFQNMTENKICEIMKYRDTSDYDECEADIVNKYRVKAIESHKNMFETVLNFYTLNEKAYIRMKHGNSLFYSLDTVKIYGLDTFVIPVEYNTKSIEQVDILMLNSFIYQKTYKLFQYIQDFQRILIDMNISFIETGEVYHPVGLVVMPESETDKELLDGIILKYTPQTAVKHNINTTINLNANPHKVEKIVDFYNSIPL